MSEVLEKIAGGTTAQKVYTYEEVVAATTEYFKGDDLAATVWASKYALRTVNEETGEYIMYELTPDDMHRRLAREFARIEKKYPNPMSEDEIYGLLKDFKYIVPQGSPMAGIGNNFQIMSIGNCFVVGNPQGEGDSYGAIFRIDERIAQLQKRRSGVGTDLSDVRPAGTKVNNAAITSTGVVPFMERYSNTTREVAQGGRRGALMESISIRHPEAEAFVDAKMDSTKVTGANISLKVHDDFMEAVLAGGEYTQQWPIYAEDPKIKQNIDATLLWNKIIHNAWKSAEPGVLFWDQIIRESPADCYTHMGFGTTSTNPCGELPLPPGDSCRLLVLNLYSYVVNPFTKNAKFDYELFRDHAQKAQRLMDDLIDLELEKIDKIIKKVKSDPENKKIKANELDMWLEVKDKCEKGRRTGTGITGEGDMLAALGYQYGTKKATSFAVKIQKELTLNAYKSSCIMAKERGAFPMYDESVEVGHPFITRVREADEELDGLMSKYGRRNVALLTIAPTGSVSILTQTTSGIECAFMVAYKRRRKVNPSDKNVVVAYVDDNGDSWEEYMVFHHHFKTWMLYNGIDPAKVAEMSTDELNELIAKSPYHGAMSNDVDWVEKVRMQGAIQKWIDHSISVTVNLPNDVDEALVNDVYVTAWKSGCKGCTIYRDGCRSGVLISADEKKEEEVYSEGDNHAPKRPKYLECDVIRFMNKGENWIGFVGLYDGRPYEFFTGAVEAMSVPHSIEKGRIRKTKVTEERDGESVRVSKYDLLYVDHKGEEIEIEWLNHKFNSEYWNYAKLISGVLRHKMPLPYVVDLIKSLNIDDDVISTWKNGVARMIKRYIKDGTKAKSLCQNCGSESIVYQEGCLICLDCGSSKCS